MAKSQWSREPRNYRVIAGSFLVAIGFWFAVSMSGSFVAQYNVPLEVVDMPKDVALSSPFPDEVEIALEGPGWQLLFLSVGDQLHFDIPGSRLLRKKTISTVSLLSEAVKLPPGVRVIRAYPEAIAISLDKFSEKKVPLALPQLNISYREGFGMTGDIALDPDSVTLSGAEKIIKNITEWSVVPNEYQELSLPVMEDVAVTDSLHGLVRVSPEKVQILIPVEQLADVAFENVRVVVEDVPQGKDVLLLNSKVKIYVRGGVNTLSNLEDEDFTAVIDYVQVRNDTTGSVAPRIVNPYGLTLLRVEPETIRYTVRQK